MSDIVGKASEKAHEMLGGKEFRETDAIDYRNDPAESKQGQFRSETRDPENNNHHLTTNTGLKVENTDAWLKVVGDKQGPSLLQDHHGREKIHHFDHERIPERVVHARGAAAHGTFRLHESAADVTNAKILTDTSLETPIFIRFSTVLGSRGSADTVRDVRGFAVRFYTPDGNWDIVGNNIPVFFIQDAIKFPDVIHAGKPEPHNEVPQAQSAHNNFWDFMGLMPETAHMHMWTMSDRAIPRSYRMMQGFGVNTYALINAEGKRTFAKFHFTPVLGVHSLVWDEALKVAGQDPDFHRKDLYAAIKAGAFPKWKFGIQCLAEDDPRIEQFDFDILDATKVWPEEDVPIRYIGELELNRNVDEYFPETEQVAFCTSNIVNGIDFSDDPLLQGRNFSYLDTQLNRFGGSFNYNDLPINRPACPVMNHQRDGFMRYPITKGKTNYTPNRFNLMPTAKKEEGGYVHYPAKIEGMQQRLNSPKFKEYYNQATMFYNSLAPHEKAHLQGALSFELGKCNDQYVISNMIERLNKIDFDLAKNVAIAAGQDPPANPKPKYNQKVSKPLSQTHYTPAEPIIATRRIALLLADGFDGQALTAFRQALAQQGQALCFVIAPRRNTIKAAGGETVDADYSFETARSTLFDAVLVPGGAESVQTLSKSGRGRHFILESFMHCKAIGAVGEAVDFVNNTCQLPGIDVSQGDQVVSSYGVVTSSTVGDTSYAPKEASNFISAFAFAVSMHRNYDRELHGLTQSIAA